MKYVVVDFEMNPLPKKMKQVREICQQEIIEIGAVMLDDDWQEIDAYKSLVKPEYADSPVFCQPDRYYHRHAGRRGYF